MTLPFLTESLPTCSLLEGASLLKIVHLNSDGYQNGASSVNNEESAICEVPISLTNITSQSFYEALTKTLNHMHRLHKHKKCPSEVQTKQKHP